MFWHEVALEKSVCVSLCLCLCVTDINQRKNDTTIDWKRKLIWRKSWGRKDEKNESTVKEWKRIIIKRKTLQHKSRERRKNEGERKCLEDEKESES